MRPAGPCNRCSALKLHAQDHPPLRSRPPAGRAARRRQRRPRRAGGADRRRSSANRRLAARARASLAVPPGEHLPHDVSDSRAQPGTCSESHQCMALHSPTAMRPGTTASIVSRTALQDARDSTWACHKYFCGSRRTYTWKVYIYKVLKQVHPVSTLSPVGGVSCQYAREISNIRTCSSHCTDKGVAAHCREAVHACSVTSQLESADVPQSSTD